ncbi:hypothetical protein CCHR01_18822 [Colletotrichum chrysophilum]|uniref:DUF6594 domain-containing protein n=1 Tax=Colletotrichum chrysophilum TaxID=1836956 RepID=A0AAD8ZZS4_9PEZI|nr:hypothetical protein CCHR01_18822 [Colletotrichum chrysophilum]
MPSYGQKPVDLELGCQTTNVPQGKKSKTVPRSYGLWLIYLVEDYRAGYPRFAALIAASDSFFTFRRFLRLRARILLLKQDHLSVLEEQLDQLDENEESPLFLGRSRCDKNDARHSLLREIEQCLADYDSFCDQTHRTLSLSPAGPRDILSLRNWVEDTSCLSRNETAYLEETADLAAIATPKDSAMEKLEDWVEDKLIQYHRGFRKVTRDKQSPLHDVSKDTNVYIYSGSLIKQSARALMLCLVTGLILTPVVICIVVDSVVARVFVIIISTVLYLFILSRLTNSRMMELILAGAT